MKYIPRPYQAFGTEHILKHPYSGLFYGMGLGKTIATLTAIDLLMNDFLEVDKVLVIGTKKIAETVWHTEAAKWDHTKHLKFSLILGTERQRKEALRAKADVYVINREMIAWLVAYYGGAFPFDMLVIDELSSFKSPKSQRFKALKQIRPRIKRVTALTGTPRPHSLLDLWSELYLLDMGERLGKTYTGYRDKYFKPGRRNGHVIYDYDLKKGDDILGADIYEKEAYDKISDICISAKAEDWLNLLPLIQEDINVPFPVSIRDQYEEFERKQVLALDDVNNITAINSAALTNKLRQFANGAVYTSKGEYYEVHNLKIERLEEDLEVLDGEPYLLFYQFRHDVERIMKYLKAFKPRLLTSAADVFDWNKKKIPFMLAHAASAGHGLNLQEGGNHLGWFGIDWNLELYQQAPERIHRPGVIGNVFMRRYLIPGTIEDRVAESLDTKADGQDACLNATKAIIAKHTGMGVFA